MFSYLRFQGSVCRALARAVPQPLASSCDSAYHQADEYFTHVSASRGWAECGGRGQSSAAILDSNEFFWATDSVRSQNISGDHLYKALFYFSRRTLNFVPRSFLIYWSRHSEDLLNRGLTLLRWLWPMALSPVLKTKAHKNCCCCGNPLTRCTADSLCLRAASRARTFAGSPAGSPACSPAC